jgi:hypothetical protein
MIKVGKFVLEHDLIIATQEIGKIMYRFKNEKKKTKRQMSSEIYKHIQRHFNVVQVYVKGIVYILQNRGQNISDSSTKNKMVI